MIVLIAPEKDIESEIELLHQLFEAGLEWYHFRKPDKDYQQHCHSFYQPNNYLLLIVHYQLF